MRENRLSGSEGGATLIPSSLPLSFTKSLLRDKFHNAPTTGQKHLTPVDEFGARSLPTPRGRIRGQPARRSLQEFQTTGRSREDDDEDEYDDEIGYSVTESRLAATTGSGVIERWADCRETGSRTAARINNPWRVQSRAKLRVNAPAKSAGV
jgi:hypothetical protein